MKTLERIEKLIQEREENTKIIKEYQAKQKKLNKAIAQARYYITKQKKEKKI